MQRVLLSLGSLSLAAILLNAGLVLTSSGPQPQLVAVPVLAVSSQPEASDSGTPDPAATGVILIVADNYYRAFTPAGLDMGPPNPTESSTTGQSVDGAWQAFMVCVQHGDACSRSLLVAPVGGSFGPQQPIPLAADVEAAEWSPVASVLAARDTDGNLYLIDAAQQTVLLKRQAVSAYAWSGNGALVLAAAEGAGAALWRVDAAGRAVRLAGLPSPVKRLFASPDANSFAFSQDDGDGWRLLSLDAASGKTTDFGHVGAVTALGGATTVQATAPPFSIAWSRDGRYVATSPANAPFVLNIFDAQSGGRLVQHFFDEGYAGELKWSPMDDQLAISTYSPDRTRHEIYVLDLAKLAGPVTDAPRHLLSGCKIEWSPDGQFIAARREPHTAGGLEVIRTATGVHWRIASLPKLTPIAWGTDQKDASERSMAPYRLAAVLAK